MEPVGDNLYALNYQERGAAAPEYLRGDGPGGVFVFDLGAAIEARTTRTRLAEAEAAAKIGPRPEVPLNSKTDSGESIYRPPFMDGAINFGGMTDGRLYQMPDGNVVRWARDKGPGDAVEVVSPPLAVPPVPGPAPTKALDIRPPVAGTVAPRAQALFDPYAAIRGGAGEALPLTRVPMPATPRGVRDSSGRLLIPDPPDRQDSGGGYINDDGSITVNIDTGVRKGTLNPDGTVTIDLLPSGAN